MTLQSQPRQSSSIQIGRKLSPKLTLYLTRRYLLPLFCCLAAFCALFLIADILDDLEDFIEAGASIRQTILYFLMRQPVNIVHVLPMSILLSAVYMLSILARHGEIIAVRAAGLSMARCALPIWVAAILAAGTQFWLNERIGPMFEARSTMLREGLGDAEARSRQQQVLLAFRNTATRRDWFFESFSPAGVQRGVVIKQFHPKGGLAWELRARRAEIKDDEWVFHDGTQWHYTAGEMLPEPEKTLRFESLRLELPETLEQIFSSLRPVEELSSMEMVRIMRNRPDMPRSTRNVFMTTVWYRLMWPLSCIVAALFGVGMSLGNERSGALKGVAAALGLMVAYYLIIQLFVMLGRHGTLPPSIAGILPPLAFILYGGWQVRRKR